LLLFLSGPQAFDERPGALFQVLRVVFLHR
jgi:hypothetical protein